MKHLLLQFVCVMLGISGSLAAIVFSSGLQRKTVGSTCVFQWTLSGPATNFTIFNLTSWSPQLLNTNARNSVEYDRSKGVISFTLVNVQLSDAGNYSLQVTTETTQTSDSSACLFVYGYISGTWNLTRGQNPPSEGDLLEITCNLMLSSLPVAYRPALFYFWNIGKYGQLLNVTEGQVVTRYSRDPVPGHSIKNNGKTLVIQSARYPDDSSIACNGIEEGSNFESGYFYYYLTIRHRPYISSLNPPSKKFNAIVGSSVALSFSTDAYPSVTSISNWTFVNLKSVQQALPENSSAYYNNFFLSLRFNFHSSDFYGNYSISLTNPVGTTDVTFQVLPPAPPDTPSDLRLYYITHTGIVVYFNLMWSNSIEHLQTVFVRVLRSDSDEEVGSYRNNYYYENYNTTYSYEFFTNILQDSKYDIFVWSNNSFGPSNRSELQVRTRPQPKLNVSPESISINGTRGIVNFTVDVEDKYNIKENIIQIQVQWCSKLTGQSTVCSAYKEYIPNQFICENIPNGTVYYVDVIVYSGIYNKYTYYSDMVRGIRVSRTPDADDEDDECKPVLIAVIVLAVVSGVAILALIAILIAYLVLKSRSKKEPETPPRLPSASYYNVRKELDERPKSTVSDIYEDPGDI